MKKLCEVEENVLIRYSQTPTCSSSCCSCCRTEMNSKTSLLKQWWRTCKVTLCLSLQADFHSAQPKNHSDGSLNLWAKMSVRLWKAGDWPCLLSVQLDQEAQWSLVCPARQKTVVAFMMKWLVVIFHSMQMASLYGPWRHQWAFIVHFKRWWKDLPHCLVIHELLVFQVRQVDPGGRSAWAITAD